MQSNMGRLDEMVHLFADAIAERLFERMAAQGPALLTAKEVAGILRCSPRTVQHRANRGELPSIRQGRFVMFRRADIDRAIEMAARMG
jgi:excisionase family DNA binding protein